MTKTLKRVVSASVAVLMLATALAGCGKQTQPINANNPSVDIMSKSFNANSAGSDSQVVQALEDYLAKSMGTSSFNLNLKWAPSATYNEKTVTAMGSGVYPHAMLVSTRNSSVIVAARKSIFWDITDAFSADSPFPNLKQASPLVNKNISIDGRNFGIYRARELGRAGVSIRKDWLDRLGEPIPETIDDLKRVMERFTKEDPDGNGVDGDTYGMIITNYLSGPLDNLAIWMGAPNAWGLNEETGQLEPSFMFDEYIAAMDLIKDWYQKGYVNTNLVSMPSDKWNEQFLNGKAGIIIDVADRARRLAQNIEKMDPNAVVDVFGYVKKDANTEPRTLPTTGYDSFYVIPTVSVPTEDQRDFVLRTMDHLNDEEAVNLMNYGIKGIHYTVDENNYVTKTEDKALLAEYNDLNQLSMGIVSYPDGLKTKYTVPVAEKIDQVYADNKNWAVANPAEPYVSPTYARRATSLDSIMSAAKMQYCTGGITLDQYKAEIERWKNMGGSDVIKEINESYAMDSSVER